MSFLFSPYKAGWGKVATAGIAALSLTVVTFGTVESAQAFRGGGGFHGGMAIRPFGGGFGHGGFGHGGFGHGGFGWRGGYGGFGHRGFGWRGGYGRYGWHRGYGFRRFGYGFGYGFGPAIGFGLGYGLVAGYGYGYPYGDYGYYGGYGYPDYDYGAYPDVGYAPYAYGYRRRASFCNSHNRTHLQKRYCGTVR